MTDFNIGYITLNISFFIYIIVFIPQIIHNLQNSNLVNISVFTQFFMIITSCANLIYGIGMGLQLEYILVSIIYISALSIQQYQIFSLQIWSRKVHFFFLGIIILTFLMLFINNIVFYSSMGIISTIGYIIYFIPQLFKNYKQKSTKGFSSIFISLSVISSFCDIISSFYLNWPLVSKITLPLFFLLLLLFSYQKYIYRKIKDYDIINLKIKTILKLK